MKATNLLSVLLNLARLISIRLFSNLACCRISVPICSPSRSQSVHIYKTLADLALLRILSAMALFSYQVGASIISPLRV